MKLLAIFAVFALALTAGALALLVGTEPAVTLFGVFAIAAAAMAFAVAMMQMMQQSFANHILLSDNFDFDSDENGFPDCPDRQMVPRTQPHF